MEELIAMASNKEPGRERSVIVETAMLVRRVVTAPLQFERVHGEIRLATFLHFGFHFLVESNHVVVLGFVTPE